MPTSLTPDQVSAALVEPFPPGAVKWKAQTVTTDKARAMAVAYHDARMVMKRLDAVVGIDGWEERYRDAGNGNVVCTLSIKFGDTWVQREGIGTPSGQPDAGDKAKAAFSEALKLAGVKFGIGRYLYDLPKKWCAYDAQKKQLTEFPQLPAWAVPDAYKPAGKKVADTVARLAIQYCQDARRDVAQYTAFLLKELGYTDAKVSVAQIDLRHAQAMQRKILADAKELIDGTLPDNFPKTGKELADRVAAKDAELAKLHPRAVGVGKLIEFVTAAGVKEGMPSDLAAWQGNKAMRIGVDAVSAFVAGLPKTGRADAPKDAAAANTTVNGTNPTDRKAETPDDADAGDYGDQYAGDDYEG